MQGENGIIIHKLIFTAMKKKSICGGFSENRRLVRADNRKQRRALWSSISQERADDESVNEGGTAEDF